MLRWQTLKQIKGETDVYEDGNVFMLGKSISFAMGVGPVKRVLARDDNGTPTMDQPQAWRVHVPGMGVSVLATLLGEV